MPTYEHPLQLFSLEVPSEWEARYQEGSASVLFVYAGSGDGHDASVTCVAPLPGATTEGEQLTDEVIRAAAQVGLNVTPAAVRTERWDQAEVGYVETTGEVAQSNGQIRLWVMHHGPVRLYISQLGPGTPLQRDNADTALRSLRFPEIMPPTADEFQQRVMEVISAEYPGYQAEARGPWVLALTNAESGVVTTLSLENLYRTCLLNSEFAGAIIREYMQQLLESSREPDAYDHYDDARERLMPMLKSDEWVREVSETQEIISAGYAQGLRLCFAVDEPTRMAYITRELLDGWDLPLERVQEVAQDNLAAKTAEVEMAVLKGEDGGTYALVINTQDGYDATRIVLPGVREAFAAELGDEYLVGLPNRDFLIAFSDRDPEMTANIIRQVKQDHQRMNHPLTSTIYRVRDDVLAPTDL